MTNWNHILPAVSGVVGLIVFITHLVIRWADNAEYENNAKWLITQGTKHFKHMSKSI